jgi:hypothetical protein
MWLVLPIWCSEKSIVLLWHQLAASMALKSKGRFINRPTQTGGKKYDKFFVYIPTEVAKDSQFPFKPGDLLSISLNSKKKKLELSKA